MLPRHRARSIIYTPAISIVIVVSYFNEKTSYLFLLAFRLNEVIMSGKLTDRAIHEISGSETCNAKDLVNFFDTLTSISLN